MTVCDNSGFAPELLTRKLNECYERLAQLVDSSNDNAGEAIYQAVTEAEQLVSGLTEASKQKGIVFERAELLELNQKIASLMENLRKKLSISQGQLVKVKKGKTAIKGYSPIRTGMGFTEGKFVDSKK